jgi:hypothetical protein
MDISPYYECDYNGSVLYCWFAGCVWLCREKRSKNESDLHLLTEVPWRTRLTRVHMPNCWVDRCTLHFSVVSVVFTLLRIWSCFYKNPIWIILRKTCTIGHQSWIGDDFHLCTQSDGLCGLVVRVPGYRSRGPGSIPGATRFSEK